MADQELLEILKQGVEVWNKWRSEHPKDVIDFRKVDLSGANLHGADPGLVNFIEANLIRVILRGADLSQANLTRANLSGAHLNAALLNEADLHEVVLMDKSFDIRTIKALLWGLDYPNHCANFI